MAEGRLEFFRTQNGHDQVDEAGERDETDDNGFHGSGGGVAGSADPVAKFDVSGGDGEKGQGERDKDEVVHGCGSSQAIPPYPGGRGWVGCFCAAQHTPRRSRNLVKRRRLGVKITLRYRYAGACIGPPGRRPPCGSGDTPQTPPFDTSSNWATSQSTSCPILKTAPPGSKARGFGNMCRKPIGATGPGS